MCRKLTITPCIPTSPTEVAGPFTRVCPIGESEPVPLPNYSGDLRKPPASYDDEQKTQRELSSFKHPHKSKGVAENLRLCAAQTSEPSVSSVEVITGELPPSCGRLAL